MTKTQDRWTELAMRTIALAGVYSLHKYGWKVDISILVVAGASFGAGALSERHVLKAGYCKCGLLRLGDGWRAVDSDGIKHTLMKCA